MGQIRTRHGLRTNDGSFEMLSGVIPSGTERGVLPEVSRMHLNSILKYQLGLSAI